MPRRQQWRVTLRMPARLTERIADWLKGWKETIELEYAKGCPEDEETAQEITVAEVERRARSVVVVVESDRPPAINIVSDAIMASLPGDCHEVQVPYWS